MAGQVVISCKNCPFWQPIGLALHPILENIKSFEVTKSSLEFWVMVVLLRFVKIYGIHV